MVSDVHEQLCNVIVKGDVHRLKAMIEADPSLLIFEWSVGTTPLTIAVEQGQFEIIDVLVKNGVDVNRRSVRHWVSGRTTPGMVPLMYARDPRTVDVLIGHGADVNAVDDLGGSVFFHLGRRYDPELLRRLIDHGARPTSKEMSVLLEAAMDELAHRNIHSEAADPERITELERFIEWVGRFTETEKHR